MSLLSPQGYTDTVTVILRTTGVDRRGAQVPVELGRVLCSGRLEPSTQGDVERYAGTGVAVQDVKRFITRSFPGDDLAQVVTGDGTTYDVLGAPRRHRSSRRTTRDIVLLSATAQVRGANGLGA